MHLRRKVKMQFTLTQPPSNTRSVSLPTFLSSSLPSLVCSPTLFPCHTLTHTMACKRKFDGEHEDASAYNVCRVLPIW